MTQPQISILIPNYNNGRESSRDGTFDMLGTLLQSLHETLITDPTPVEIIIADDGSTDDSLETARRWASQQWTQGGQGLQPFATLIELEHCGVLSVVTNRLMEAARGEIIVRLDGDVEMLTEHWAARLVDAFETLPGDVGVIGPKQLAPDGFIHSAGDWLLHPRGYHHIGQGCSRTSITRSIEVDHVMGCFYCQRRAVWEQIGPYDESIMRGQTVDYGMRARLHGWRCVFIPTIEFTHHHVNRALRTSRSDAAAAITAARTRFLEKWGFDRVAPDLDEVASRYRGTPLLWNARVFGPSANSTSEKPIALEHTRWQAFANDTRTQQIIANQMQLIERAIEQVHSVKRICSLGCGDGLLCHLLAQRGFDVVGVDRNNAMVSLANEVVGRGQYPSKPPRFHHQSDLRRIAVEPASAELVLLIDVIETHPNPFRLLKQAHEIVSDDGAVLIVTPQRTTPLDPDIDRFHLYREHELIGQINATGWLTIDPEFASPAPSVLTKFCRPRRRPEGPSASRAERTSSSREPVASSAE